MDNFIRIPQTSFLIKDLSDKFDFSILDKEYHNSRFIQNKFNLISDDKYVLNRKDLIALRDILSKESSDFMRNAYAFKDFERIEVTTSWFNNTTKGKEHHVHEHPYSVISGVIYLDDNEENMNFSIHKEMDPIPGVLLTGKTIMPLSGLLQINNIDPKQSNNLKNHVIMFLSNIKHSVDPVKTSLDRRSLAFNTFFKGFVGDRSGPLSNIVY